MIRPRKFYGWKMVGVLWCVYFLMQGLVLYGEPVVNSYMIVHMGFGRSVLGAGSAMFMLFQGFSGPFVSKGIKAKGIRFTIIIGAIFVAVSSILMGTVVSKPWQYLVAFGAISGVGIGLSGMFSVQSGITYWFRKKRGLAMSIALTGAGAGGFISGYVLNYIINTTGSWRNAWHFITVTCILTIILVAVLVVNRPEAIGQVPDGEDISDEPQAKKLRDSKVYKTLTDVKVSDVMKDRRIWFILIALLALRFTYSMCIAHSILHLFDVGIPKAVAAMAVGTMTLFSVLGRLLPGTVIDKIEPRIVWFGGMVVFIIGFMNLMLATSSANAIVFSILVGMGFGSSYVCSATMVGNYYGVNTFPSIMGIIFPAQMIFGAFAPLLAGIIYDTTKSYVISFTFGLVIMIIGAIAVLLAVPPKVKEDQNPVVKSGDLHA
ncbi:MFS transporter [Dehalobacter sp. DCM]|uniref:MFS transporter n=1 Tax=Dehalobacter sp. DCM TaxID=2907827 RepID=UPI0030816EE4|nr:MFS transporter [Dehalobacter sp. DCM]